MKLLAATVPAPEDEAEALFAAPEEDQPGNVIEDEQSDLQAVAPEGETAVEEEKIFSDEVNGNTISDSKPEQLLDDEQMEGKSMTDDPENP
jgi:hypothetical protein